MQVEVRFHGIARSKALKARIEERAALLTKLEPGLLYCRVVVERPHRHHQQGEVFHVRVALKWGGGSAVIDRECSLDPRHEDPYVAVHDAFDAARRQLEAWHARVRDTSEAARQKRAPALA